MKIAFLHHSTGQNIWNGNRSTLFSKVFGRINHRLGRIFYRKPALQGHFDDYNRKNNTSFNINELVFPKREPYGWHNYPFDYYNIWVKNGDKDEYQNEPTLDKLTKEYQVIIFKHCFPVSNIKPDNEHPDIDSDYKSLANYKLQYLALREKLYQYKDTIFIVFTGAARVQSQVSMEEGTRAKEFFRWVVSEWDKPDDNIFIWDLFELQTEGGVYFKDAYASSPADSHPSAAFSEHLAELLFNRIVDIIETKGARTTLTGNFK